MCQMRKVSALPTRCVIQAALVLLIGLLVGSLLASCTPDGAPQTIVVTATATHDEPRAQLGSYEMSLLYNTGVNSSEGKAVVVAPNGEPTTVLLTQLLSNGEPNNGPEGSTYTQQAVEKVEDLVQSEAAPGPISLLGALGMASRAASGPATLIAISSGLDTAGGLDLNLTGWVTPPRTVVSELEQEGLIPDLHGWTVVMEGLGDTEPPQQPLPLPMRDELDSLWSAICRATGARCVLDDTLRATSPSHSKTSEPTVGVPAIPPCCSGPRPIPADLLFQFNSPILGPDADAILGPEVDAARAGDDSVSVVATASPDGGSAAYNDWLSSERASNTAERMIQLGLPASQIVEVRGLGTNGVPPSDCIVSGVLSESVCSQFREVSITLTPSP